MQLRPLIAFAAFAFVGSITPGPNNTMLLASGLNYGFIRTVPHVLGIGLGCVVMVLLAGLGFDAVFAVVPWLKGMLSYATATYLLWLAWKIAWAGPVAESSAEEAPLTVWQAAAFQWINPKAWLLAAGAVGVYAPRGSSFANVAVLAALLGVVMLPSVSVWAGFGTVLRPMLRRPSHVRCLNATMALLLVLSLLPILAR